MVRIPDSPTLDFNMSSFSVSFWLKTSNSNAFILEHRRDDDGQYAGWSVELVQGMIKAEIRSGALYYVDAYSNTLVNDSKFHHVAWVVDRQDHTSKLYIDGNLEDTAKTWSVGNINQDSIGVGMGWTGSPNTPNDAYTRLLDQNKIYNKPLTDNDVEELYHGG